MTITSQQNEKLKQLRKLARRDMRTRADAFIAEGEDLLAAADAAGWVPVERYCAAGSGLVGQEVEPKLLAAVSQLGSGTRTLAVYRQRWAGAVTGPLCVALHGIADPGNVGTVLRSALAFGAASVAFGPGCADPYGPKAVRASMGAIFAVAKARFVCIDELPGTKVGLDAHGAEALEGWPGGRPKPLTLLIGAERAGLPDDVLAACDRVARIPIHSESLNAAMAATVALYEVTRETVSAEHRMPSA